MARAAYLHSSAVLTRTCFTFHRSPAPILHSNNLRQIQPFTSKRHFLFSSNQCKNPLKMITAQARRSFSSSSEEEFASAADLQYQGPLEIVKYPDPVLRAKNKRVRTFDENLKRIVDEMFDIMYRTDGIGLSAPQVGINVQLMVFNTVGERGEGEEIVLVNPRITRYSKKIVPYEEGCLSFPRIYGDVERPDSLKVDAQDIGGSDFELNLTGLSARVFQHEYDHLLGILFIDKMSDEVLDSIRVDLQASDPYNTLFHDNLMWPWKRVMRRGLDHQVLKRLINAEERQKLLDLGNLDDSPHHSALCSPVTLSKSIISHGKIERRRRRRSRISKCQLLT